ncbi:MAG: DUF2793 domain-containing protein [Bosea sp. (in: a-proteobacteria)]
MSDTTLRHRLPLLAAAQAQKHVTHNEALSIIDTLLNLRLKSRGFNVPPASPVTGECHIVGSVPTAAWTGQAAMLAVWSENAWLFHQPQAGWLASTTNPQKLEIFDGAIWREAMSVVSTLGINATPDAANPVVMRVNNILATATLQAEGGNGDVRLKINRELSTDTASLLFQSGFSGRAEMGIVGSDQFSIKVSPDANTWHDALAIAPATGVVTFPSGALVTVLRNLVINGDFQFNQRAFGGGALAAGTYGLDRWRATVSSSLALNAGILNLGSGAIAQTLEAAAFGMSGFAAMPYTVSIESLSGGVLGVTLGDATGQITPGAGRRSVTLTPSSVNATMNLTLTAGSGGSAFTRVQVQEGFAASAWSPRYAPLETLLCQRYFWRPGHDVFVDTYQVSGGYDAVMLALSTRMRILPTVTFSVSEHENVAVSERIVYAVSPQMARAQVRATMLGRCYAIYSAVAFSAEY